MAELGIDERQLFYLEFVNRENHFRHAGRGQELLQFELLRDANPQAAPHCAAAAASKAAWTRNAPTTSATCSSKKWMP